MDRRRRSRSPKHRRHQRRKHRRRSSSRSSSRARYKFDSPPKTFLDYSQKVWNNFSSSNANPQDFIQQIQQVGSTIASSGAHKIDRELYVGNLPSGITQDQLVDLLNTIMKRMGLQQGDGEPVLAAWISNDGHYAFIQFRSIEQAKAAYALDNVNVLGQPLKVGRPKTYAGNQPVTVAGMQALQMSAIGLNKVTDEMASQMLGGKGRLMIAGLPHGFFIDELEKILEEFGELKCFDMPKDNLTGLTKGYAIFEFKEEEANASILQQANMSISGCSAKISRVNKESLAQTFLPAVPDLDNKSRFNSRILVLKNMIRITDLEHEEDYQELHEDVYDECNKYGKVTSMVIPRPGEYTSGIGKIFVEFAQVEDAIRAKAGLQGMKFNEKRVECGFHPEELFFQGNFKGD